MLQERRHELYALAGESDIKGSKWESPLRCLWVRDLHCGSCDCVQDVDLVAALHELWEETNEGEHVLIKIW